MGLSTRLGKLGLLLHVGSTVLSQALLSGGNFLVSFLLIRRQSEAQYGYFVLANVTLLLLASLQSAFFQPSLWVGLEREDAAGRAGLVGALVHDRRRVSLAANIAAAALLLAAWASGWVPGEIALIGASAILAAFATLQREFFRGLLLARHRAVDVLHGDLLFVLCFVPGAWLATYAPFSTATAIAAVGVAAAASGWWLSRLAWRREPWRTQAPGSRLREIFSQGAWSVFGAAMHWSFSQGYTYLVASLVDVRAVAALAATRLLLMPVNLLSNGVGQAMMPLSARWHEKAGPRVVFQRLLLQCAALATVIVFYAGAIWWLRDFVFLDLLHKDFADRDTLLALWCVVFLMMAMRDQLGQMMIVRSRLRRLAKLTTVSAIAALASIVIAIPRFGPAGAPLGVLIGEAINVAGLFVLAWIESRAEHLPENAGVQ